MISKMSTIFFRVSGSGLTKIVSLLLIFCLLLGSIVFVHFYHRAKAHLLENDPRKLQNRSEMRFYFAPLILRRGNSLNPEELKQYLREINYLELEGDSPGTFFANGDLFKINSRLAQFPSALLTIGKNKLQSIAVNNAPVEQIEVEPLPMQNAVHFVMDKSLKDHNTRRVVLEAGRVPQLVIDAVTSAEDYRFFQHYGMNWATALYRMANKEGGGSSITQQLIKNNLIKGAKDEFYQDFGLGKRNERKLFEPFFAMAAESSMSKDEILAAYLSMIPMGASNGVELHGIAVASLEYFNKPLSELSLGEAATLAGMICAPSAMVRFVRNGNFCSEKETKENDCKDLVGRRNRVLGLMRRNHSERYSEQDIEKAKAEPLNFVFVSERREQKQADPDSSFFARYAAQHLPPEIAKLRAEEGELSVVTPLDRNLQREAGLLVKTVANGLQPKIARICEAQKLQNPQKFDEKKIDCQTVKPQIAIIAADAQSGAILAMIGGMAQRSPGSGIKPFYFLKAIETGVWENQPFTAATFLNPSADADKLSEKCSEPENIGVSGSIRDGVAQSSNLHACAASKSAKKPADFVGQLTNSKPESSLTAAIGGTAGSETRLVDLIPAYTIFSNNGKISLLTAHQTVYQNGHRTDFSPPQTTLKTAAAPTFITADMLRSVMKPGGTAANFRSLAKLPSEIQIGGKTGSGMVSDLWFIGFTPRLVFGVWVGMSDNLPHLKRTDGFTGGKTAVPIAAKFIQSVAKYRPDLLSGQFVRPENVVKLRVNPVKGCEVKSGGVEEYFILERIPLPCK